MKLYNLIILISITISISYGQENSGKPKSPKINKYSLSDSIGQVAYFNSLKESDFKTRAFWDTIVVYKENHSFGRVFYNTPAFDYILKHRKEFDKMYTPDSVQKIICRVFEFTLKFASNDSVRFKKIKTEIIANTGNEASRIVEHIDMANYYDKKDYVNYANIASHYLDNYCMNEEDKLNWTAWQFYENVDDKEHLKKALSWTKRAIDLNDSYDNRNTYAHLLYKLGNTKEAKTALEAAINKGKTEKVDYNSSTELLEQLKK